MGITLGIVGAVSSIAGGAIAGSAAQSAADTQAAAARYSADVQKQIYDSTKATLAPFVNIGQTATGRLQNLLGIPSQGQVGGAPTFSDLSSLDPSKLSAPQLAALNAKLTEHVRESLGKQYESADSPLGSQYGTTGNLKEGAPGVIKQADGTLKYDPNSVNVDLSKPEWNLADLQKYYAPDLGDSGLLSLANKAVEQPLPTTPAGGNYTSTVNSLLPGGDSQSQKAIASLLPNSDHPDQALAAMKGYLPGSGNLLLNALGGYIQGSGFDANPDLKNLQSFVPGSGVPTDYSVDALAGFVPGSGKENALTNSLDALLGLVGVDGKSGPGSGAAIQAALEATPGYQFTRDQGLKATQNSYAAKGLGASGAALKGAAQFVTGLADQTYEQRLQDYLGAYSSQGTMALNNFGSRSAFALNNYNNKFTNNLNTINTGFANALNSYNAFVPAALNTNNTGVTNTLNAAGQQISGAQNLLTVGANAGANQGTIGAQTGSNIGSAIVEGGNAAAAGIVGSANATTNAIQGAGNALVSGLTYNKVNGDPSAQYTPTAYYPGQGSFPAGGNALNPNTAGMFDGG